MRSKKLFPCNNFQQGVGIVEVMVALLLMGIGLLGALSLQANGLQSNQRANFVMQAHFLAQGMVDNIVAFDSASNANAGANNGEYDGVDTGTTTYLDPACGSIGESCTSAKAVELDLYKWQQNLQQSRLPNVRGTIDWTSPVYTIRVMWDRDRTGATGTDCTSTDKTTNLTCFEMQVRL